MNSYVRDFAVLGALAVAAASVSWFGSEGLQHLVAQLLILGLFAAAFDLAYGVTGLFSMGHAAFFGAGAYAYGILTLSAGVGAAPALFFSVVAGAVAAALFGVLAIRSAGIYFALATLALGQLANVLVEVKLRDWTGGADGLAGVPRPEILGWSFDATADFLGFVCGAFMLSLACLALIRRSGYGQVLKATRENPLRTQQLGYNIYFYRLSALAVSGGFSGLAGALLSALSLFVGPDMMRWNLSGDVLIMTILGGAGTLLGPLVGVLVFETAKEVISRYTEHWYGFVGLLFIIVTLLVPSGLVGIGASLGPRARAWFRNRVPTAAEREVSEP